jgi:hypothetical protein
MKERRSKEGRVGRGGMGREGEESARKYLATALKYLYTCVVNNHTVVCLSV